ncbi:plasmid pRiA4b ORF-3 family protein, partial [Pseudomonas viridiflava]
MAKIIHFPTPDSDLLLLHIELKEITPKIWRRFAVPANITLV